MRKAILLPALAFAAGLFLNETSHAQPLPPRPGPIGPPPSMRPIGPPPVGIGIGVRPSPGLGIGISIGAPIPGPILPPPRPPIVVVDPICVYYSVVYRDCAHDPWRVYRSYESHRMAHLVADQLRDMGYQARVLHD